MQRRLRYEDPSKVAIYVAGAWTHRAKIKVFMDRLRAARYQVISGWIERENGLNMPDNLEHDAQLDIEEVTRADVFIAIMDDPEYAYRGTFTELGCAIALKKQIIIMCPGTAQPIFCDPVGSELYQTAARYEYSHQCMTNVFYWHPLVSHCASEDQIFCFL